VGSRLSVVGGGCRRLPQLSFSLYEVVSGRGCMLYEVVCPSMASSLKIVDCARSLVPQQITFGYKK
jgi:hypothetical protein